MKPGGLRFSTSVLVLAACGVGTAGVDQDDGSSGGMEGATANETGDSTDDGSGGSVHSDSADETAGDTSGGSDDGLPLFESGERLRARLWDGGDGAQIFIGWYDTELETECYAIRLADGQIRCTPRWGHAGTFGDPECTQLVYDLPPGCVDTPDYSLAPVLDGWCAAEGLPRHELYEIEERLADGPTFYLDADGGCHQSSSETVRYALVPGDASAFVTFSESVVEYDDRVGVKLLSGKDGSHQVYQAIDLESGYGCGAWYQDPVTMCVPPVGLGIRDDLYTDEACDDAGVAVDYQSGQGCEPQYAFTSDALFSLGDSLPASSISQESAGSCEPWESFGATAYEVGGPLPEGTFPSVQLGAIGSGRLSLPTMETLDGKLLVAGAVYGWDDAELGKCYPRRTTQGDLRCSPADGGTDVGRYWTDAACSGQTLHREGAPEIEAAGTLRRVYIEQECGERLVDHVMEIGAEYSGPVYRYDSEDDSCTSVDGDPARFFEHGEALPTTILAPVDVLVD